MYELSSYYDRWLYHRRAMLYYIMYDHYHDPYSRCSSRYFTVVCFFQFSTSLLSKCPPSQKTFMMKMVMVMIMRRRRRWRRRGKPGILCQKIHNDHVQLFMNMLMVMMMLMMMMAILAPWLTEQSLQLTRPHFLHKNPPMVVHQGHRGHQGHQEHQGHRGHHSHQEHH